MIIIAYCMCMLSQYILCFEFARSYQDLLIRVSDYNKLQSTLTFHPSRSMLGAILQRKLSPTKQSSAIEFLLDKYMSNVFQLLLAASSEASFQMSVAKISTSFFQEPH